VTVFVAHDLEAGAALWLFAGPRNDDVDFQLYLDTIVALDAKRAGLDEAGMVVAEPGNPPPSSMWRKRIADATATLRAKKAAFALVSASPIVRGVVTAINWLRPPPYAAGTFAKFGDASAWLEKELARPLPMARLLDEARSHASSQRSSA
jgi:hypothetical protein